jgi:uncharacterized protein with von Willebrand factor type A (vWA) domain
MYEGMSQAEVIRRLFGRPSASGERVMPPPPPRATVEHDSVDKMQFGNHADDSPRFRRIAVEDAPQIAPDAPDPDPIDFTQATPDEIKAWQAKARDAKAKREAAPAYDAWSDLTRDIFYSYHHSREPQVKSPDQVDPAVAHHAKIASRMVSEDEHAQARNLTRDDATASAIATMAASRALREALEDELIDQARQSEDFEQARDSAEGAQQTLDDLRAKAQEQHAQGQPVESGLKDQIKDAVAQKRQAQAQAAQIAQSSPTPMSQAGHDAIVAAVQAAHEAAQNAASIPSFGQGFGAGEPRYESPEQALTIADMWANNETLKAVSELYGRLDRDMRFKRAKRVTGGADEIVDLKFGDDLRRILPTELGALADDDFEDDFYMRFLGGEVRVFDTVGEESAGKGPIVLTCDESYSMNGERNVWAKALALALLNITRREKRDFAYVAWASGGQCKTHLFKAKDDLNAQAIVDMASHFFGGGTTPVLGLAEADRIMSSVPEFRKADVVKLTDGEAAFGPEDKRLRDRMAEKGVRFHGVGIGQTFGYLKELTDDVVSVRDFDLDNPSEATAHLATHIT